MDSWDIVKITIKGEESEYITLEKHNKLINDIMDYSNIQQLIELIDIRLNRGYQKDNPYFKKLKSTRLKLSQMLKTLKQ